MPTEKVVRGGADFLEWAAEICCMSPDREQVGFWFVHPIDGADGVYEGGEHLLIPASRLLRQRDDRVVPDPLDLIWACRHARAGQLTLFLVHSHTGPTSQFSTMDEAAERALASRVIQLSRSPAFGAVVIAGRAYCARMWERETSSLKASPVRIMP